MKRILLLTIIYLPLTASFSVYPMQPEDVKKGAALAKVVQMEQSRRTKSYTQGIRFKHTVNGKEKFGETTKIICPGINHTIKILPNSFFAIILPKCHSRGIPRDLSFVQPITCTQYSGPDAQEFVAFVFKTTQKIGDSKIYFEDYTRLEAFDVTIKNSTCICP